MTDAVRDNGTVMWWLTSVLCGESPWPHYNGYPAVLVHLSRISEPALRQVIFDQHHNVIR